MKAVSDVILVTPVFDNGNGGNSAAQADYVAAMVQVADEENGRLIDMRTPFVSFAAGNAAGFHSDSIHPARLSYAKHARQVDRILRSI